MEIAKTGKPFAGFSREDAPIAAEFATEAEAVEWLGTQGPEAFVEDTPGKRVLWIENDETRAFRSASLFE